MSLKGLSDRLVQRENSCSETETGEQLFDVKELQFMHIADQ